MSSSTHVLTELDDVTNVTYTLAGQTSNGASYKNKDRALSLPQTLEFAYNIGQPTAKGNDKLNITLKNSVQNGTTDLISTGSLKIVVSVPRDSAWTQTDTEDLLAQVVDLLTNAKIADIADAMVP